MKQQVVFKFSSTRQHFGHRFKGVDGLFNTRGYPVAKYYKPNSLAPSGVSRGTSSNWRAISRRT